MQVVKFRRLTYGVQLSDAKQGYETVGSMAMKCFFACCAERQGIQQFKILDNCSGYLMPGTLTLVCGPPGCGKSFRWAVYGVNLITRVRLIDSWISGYNRL